jgi:uncharacterized iron-regulated membrane protein
MIRRLFLRLHRWFGLAMAMFLFVEGFTGCLLAFNAELTKVFNPKLFVSKPAPDARLLDLATLVEKAESVDPALGVAYFARYRDDQVMLRCTTKAGAKQDIGFMYLVVDPYTGKELGRLLWCGYDVNGGFVANIMPFIFDVHMTLKLGSVGTWVLCIVALIWSVDCFIGFYLTLPVSRRSFFSRWKPAWLVKVRGGSFRLNFDLHRAGGLWFWVPLFTFAWSSVCLIDSTGIYESVMGTLFHSPSPIETIEKYFPDRPVEHPKLGWRAAQSAGEKLMAEEAGAKGFKVVRPVSLNYFTGSGLYNYIAETDRRFPNDQRVTIFFDAQTGALHGIMSSRDEHLGGTITNWLRALHMVQDPVAYLPYRILVAATGLVTVMLSITGVYIWWKKRRARQFSLSRRHRACQPELKT